MMPGKLDSEQIQILIEIQTLSLKKGIRKSCQQNISHFISGLNVLT